MLKNRGTCLFVGATALVAAAQVGCGDNDNEVTPPAPCADESGRTCIWAGTTGKLAFNGDGKHRLDSFLYWPEDMDFAPDGTPYILDWNNHAVRVVQEDQTLKTVIGNGFVGDGPFDNSDLTLPGAPGTDVGLNHPTDLAFLDDGTLLLMAWHNHKLRTYNPDTGLVWVMCGRGAGFAGDGGPAADVRFNQPNSLVVDPRDGSIYIQDQRNFRIRKISGGTDPIVTTVAGVGTPGFSGDGGSPLAAELRFEAGGNPEPSGKIALGPDYKLYVADSLNHRIRVIDFENDTIQTIAGTGEPGYSGDGGPALEAQINNPRDMEFGLDGRLYVADTENDVIRVIDLETGVIDTFAGSGERCDPDVYGPDFAECEADGVLATDLKLNRPFGIAFDQAGDLYISDTFNSRILKVAQ